MATSRERAMSNTVYQAYYTEYGLDGGIPTTRESTYPSSTLSMAKRCDRHNAQLSSRRARQANPPLHREQSNQARLLAVGKRRSSDHCLSYRRV